MKTLKELGEQIRSDEALKKQFLEAAQKGEIIEFCEANGCPATQEELSEYLDSLSRKNESELNIDELENAAGGTCNLETAGEAIFSIVTVAIGCALKFDDSLLKEGHHLGQQTPEEGRLCNPDT